MTAGQHYLMQSIPSESVFAHLPRKGEYVRLRVKGKEKTWCAKYNGRVCNRARGLSGGWKDFAFDNLLKSDVCVFELASGIHDVRSSELSQR